MLVPFFWCSIYKRGQTHVGKKMIRANLEGNYGFDPTHSFDFTRHIPEGVTLYYGIGHADTTNDPNQKVRLNLETPNMLYIYDSHYDNANFDLVLHLCPYTCNYLNELHKTQKFKPVFFPVEDIRITNQRSIDVFYAGSRIRDLDVAEMSHRAVFRILGPMKDVLQREMSAPTLDGYFKKMEILSKTKVCIVHNVLLPKSHFPNYYSSDLARKHLPWDTHDRVTPQLKSRTFEGALMGCVLLAYKDEYKTIERYFTEGEKFVYFESEADLNSKLDMILADYGRYEPIGKKAQLRERESYLTKHFAEVIARHCSPSATVVSKPALDV